MSDLPDPPDRLDSWKEIATFLGRTVRTVQRWEKTEGLPVRRGGPGRRHAVIGSREEIADWWQRQGSSLNEDEDPEPSAETDARRGHRRRLAVIGGLAAIAAGTAVVWLTWGRQTPAVAPAPAALRLGRLLAASTSEGQSLRDIPLDAVPAKAIVSPAGDRVFVPLPEAHSIAVVDVAERTVTTRIAVAERPLALAMGPDSNRLYVGGPAELAIIDLSAGTARRLPVGGTVRDLVVTADGRRVWIALAQAGLRIYDTANDRLESRRVIGCPMFFAADHRAGRLFVTYQCGGPGGRSGHDAVEIIEEGTGRSLLTRSGPPLVGSDVSLSPDGLFLWTDTADACVSPRYDNAGCPPGTGAVLLALSAATLEPVATVRVPSREFRSYPAFFPDGSRLAVGLGGLHVVNASLGHVEESLERPLAGAAVFAPDGRRLYLVDLNRRSLLEFPVAAGGDARELDGLGTYWPGDGTANDVVGGTHAEDIHDLRYTPGRLGYAFDLDEATTISFGTRFEVDILQAPSTLAAWVKARSIGRPMVMLDRAGPVGWRWSVAADGRPTFCVNRAPGALACDRGGIAAREPIAPGAWHHLAVVRSESAIELFIDGRVSAHVSLADYVPPAGADYDERRVTRLGSGAHGAASFQGLVDEIAVFHRALSADELERLARLTTFGASR